MVSKVLNIALRGAQFFCALLVMSLVGSMIATSVNGDAAIINFDLFVAVAAMLSLFYLLPTSILEGYSVPLIDLILDVFNALFWFCSAVATAAYLGVHSCNNLGYTLTNQITNSSPDTAKRCREAQASTAFLWFGWLAFTASAVFSFVNGRNSANMRGGSVRRGPSMSQV